MVLLLPHCHLSPSLCHLYHLTLAAICLSNTVIVLLCHCNITVSILTIYVSSRCIDTQHWINIQSNSWLKYDINEKISLGRLLLLNVLTICPKEVFVLLFFSHQYARRLFYNCPTVPLLLLQQDYKCCVVYG